MNGSPAKVPNQTKPKSTHRENSKESLNASVAMPTSNIGPATERNDLSYLFSEDVDTFLIVDYIREHNIAITTQG